MKLLNLLSNSGKMDRIRALTEIRLNQALWNAKPYSALTFDEVQIFLPDPVQSQISSGEADDAVSYVDNIFKNLVNDGSFDLPFPITFNPDKSLAILIYSFARYLKPVVALESGVGYGVSSTLILLAMARNGYGLLKSLDLPSLADPQGFFTGIVIPDYLCGGWELRFGSSRKLLRKLLQEIGKCSLFVSDSANIFSLQKYEFDLVISMLATPGVMIFNNVSLKFEKYLRTVNDIKVYTIWQMEKRGCVTALIIKE